MTESEDELRDRHLAEFGRRVRAVRRYRDLTQEALAERMGTTRTRVTRIEGGTVNVALDTLFKLSRALDIHPAALLDGGIEVGQAPPYEFPG